MRKKGLQDIIHLDMDAFFASVEILDNPSLRGLPVIVGGNSDRGVVSAASYGARKFGVRSAMPIVMAKKLCPTAVFIHPRLSRYGEISRQIMTIFKRYTPLVEPLSLDEAFLDVGGSSQLFGSAVAIAKTIRHNIHQELGLTVSAGVATSKLLAKIASDQNKPDGLTIVPAGEEKQFIAPLPIKRLWGVGRKTLEQLEMMGISTIGDLSKVSSELLQRKFGHKHGLHLHLTANAIDNRVVNPSRETQSIGNEDTFTEDVLDLEVLQKKLLAIAVKVGQRVRREGLLGKTVSLKVKYYNFEQHTRALTLSAPTSEDMVLYQTALQLLAKTGAGNKAVRLIGITVSNLVAEEAPRQGLLFGSAKTEKRRGLTKAIDEINEKFAASDGSKKIVPGRLI